MKNIFAFVVLLSVFTSNCYSQSCLWAKTASCSGYCRGESVSTDPSGNVYATGGFTYSSSITFDSITLLNTNIADYDIFIAKYDTEGNVLWAKSVGGGDLDIGYSVSTDTVGNVFVTGAFESSTITFDTATLTNTGVLNLFVTKYDTYGNLLWAKSANGPGQYVGNSIRTDRDGKV